MSRIFALAEWTITPDREPGTEPVTHAMRCKECEERSDASGSWEAPLSWALTHSGRNPIHTGYREIITRSYRTRTKP